MSGYIGTQPVPQATQHRETFTATASQTTFATVGYTPQFVDVYLNGIHLLDTVDYTATNSSDVVLTTGAAASDVVEIISYTPFEVANQTFTGTTTVDVLTATGNLSGVNGTFTGDVAIGDGLTVDGDAVVQGSEPRFILSETDVTGQNTRFRNSGGDLQIQTINDAYSVAANRISLDHATGDVSFYEDTGTTADFLWDASTSSLTIAGAVTPASINWSAAKRTRGTTQSMPNSGTTIVTYDTLVHDTLSELDATGRFTASVAGTYRYSATCLSASVAWAVTEQWILVMYKNGAGVDNGYRSTPHAAYTGLAPSSVGGTVVLAATDYIDIRLYHNQGGAVDILADAAFNHFSVNRIA